MSLRFLTTEQVVQVHDIVLNPGELPGLAKDKSLDGALARVHNRLAYGMDVDVFLFAALFAMAIAQAHAFNDANKRTAYQVLRLTLTINGLNIDFSSNDVADKIIELAQGHISAEDLAEWLRTQPILT